MTRQTRLALLGGEPVRKTPYPIYRTLGEEEKRAVAEVMDSGVLSQFIGAWTDDFRGGVQVRGLEAEWAAYFGARHAVAMNSATSCLYAAVGAAGVGPGDEVIASPYTMSASATAALVYGAVPVFADIDPDSFCLSPADIRRCITPRTKAIIVVDIFGHPAACDEIMVIARQHGLTVIEDAAQAPGAKLKGRYAGTLGDMGVFSLNYHKTIHCGEGGVIVTDDARLAERLRLIRNHAEAVVKAKGEEDLVNLVGYNYRMTEIEAAIAREQLKKLDRLLEARIAAAATLSARLSGLPGIIPPKAAPDTRHAWYVYAFKFDAAALGIPRADFLAAVQAEGVPLFGGYVEPLYLQPMYQRRIALGRDGFPFNHPAVRDHLNYQRGICPVAERMHFEELLYTNICHADIHPRDLEDFAVAIEKVIAGRDQLRSEAR